MGLQERTILKLAGRLAEICETKFCMSGASERNRGLRINNPDF